VKVVGRRAKHDAALFMPHASAVSEQSEQLKQRTWRLAIDVIALVRALPQDAASAVVRHQLAKSATSVAFNYRAACRARTYAEFSARLGVVAEEADETAGWLDFLFDACLYSSKDPSLLTRLRLESKELVAIFSASVGTVRRNINRR
jgi:four helix bundle protein